MKDSQPPLTPSQFEIPSTIGAAQGVSILATASLVVGISGYAFNVILSWLLPVEQYGVYGVCIAFYSVLTIFTSTAFPWATAKFLSSAETREQQYKVLRSSIAGNLLTAVVISALFYAVYSFFLPQTGIDRQLMSIILVILLLTSPLTVYLGALQGLFRFKQLGAMQLLLTLLRLASGIGLVYLGYGVFGALAGYLVAAIIALVVVVYLLRDLRFWQGKGWVDSGVLTFAPLMFLGMLGITLLSNLDILGMKFLSEGAVSSELTGYYQSALILARIPVFFAGAMIIVIFPFISRYAESGSREYSIITLKYVLIFILPLAIAIAVRPAPLMMLFFPEVYVAGADALRVVAVGMGFLSLIQVLANTFQALGQPRIPAIALIVATGVQVGALVVLIPKWGLVGAAASTTIACLFGMSWLLIRYFRAYQPRIKPTQILSLIVAFGVTGGFLYLFPLEGRLLTVVGLILAVIIYIFLLLSLRLIDERDVEILGSALPQNRVTREVIDRAKRLVIRLNRTG